MSDENEQYQLDQCVDDVVLDEWIEFDTSNTSANIDEKEKKEKKEILREKGVEDEIEKEFERGD